MADCATADEVVGPIVGTVEAESARILYRPGNREVKLRLTILNDGQVVKHVTASSSSDSDYVVQFKVDGLKSATTYSYQVEEITADGREKLLAASGDGFSFTTVNPARQGNRVTASFVSCVDIEPNGIWKEMDKLGVDTVFLMGDTPYIDTSNLPVVRQKHRHFLQMPDLAAIGKSVPVVGTWDDHDFGRNNGNGRNMMSGKVNTLRAFKEYRAHAQYGNGPEGVYHKVDLGMIEVFLLDPRYFSQTEPSPVSPDQPTCFGKEQWEWLLRGLKDSKAPFKVLATGGIWQDKKNSETDDMFTYWYERDALLNYIKAEKISGVVLLGGDIHVARHLIHPQRVGYDLHDFVISPGHTRTITELDVYHPSLEWSLVEGWQFLTLTADGTKGSPRLIAEFRQPEGVVNRKVELDLKSMAVDVEKQQDSELRAYWSFENGFKNQSILGDRVNAKPVNGASIANGEGVSGSAVRLKRGQEQYLNVPRSLIDETSTAHAVSMWMKSVSLPAHGSGERQFLIESTAEGKPGTKGAWNLSLGLRATEKPDHVNLQLFTFSLKPASKPEAAPTAVSQGPFNTYIPREQLLEKWNHVAFNIEEDQILLYLNGKNVGQFKLSIPGPACETGGLVIGGHRAGTGRNFDGLVDEVKIFQGVLTPTQITELAEVK